MPNEREKEQDLLEEQMDALDARINALEEQLAAVSQPLRTEIHDLFVQKDKLRDQYMGEIRKCSNCLADIYAVHGGWRGSYSGSMCCGIGGDLHSPTPPRPYWKTPNG